MLNFRKFCIDAEERLFIIAEVGVNHNSELPEAFEADRRGKEEAGCDAVKFQTWITEKVYSPQRSLKPDYQKLTTDVHATEFDTIKKLELSFDDFTVIKAYCDERDILFFSTPDELQSANFLVKLGMPLMKTASQDVTNLPFLRDVAAMGLPVIYSTGACTLSELVAGAEAIASATSEFVILHCVSCYPAPVDQNEPCSYSGKLRAMLGVTVGLSDHTTGNEIACPMPPWLLGREFSKSILLWTVVG